jgi:hypothetical protein
MQKIPAAIGLAWFKQGFAIFRRQPAEISTLFLAYTFLMMAVNFVPVIGQILPLLLVPIFSMAFMQACAQVTAGKRVYPTLLMVGFHSPALKRLLVLGVIYLLSILLSVAASSVIDGGAFWSMLTKNNPADSAKLAEANWVQGMLVAGIVYLPASMCLWFAAPLVAWQNMSVGKAIFYSFFAVIAAGRAFLTYAFAWLVMGIIVPSILSTVIVLIFQNAIIALLIIVPVSLMLTAILYCSFYPIYVTVFGTADNAISPLSQPPTEIDPPKSD